MPLGLKAIRPKRTTVIDTSRVLRDALKANDDFISRVQRRMQKYPAQEPTDYVRTGDYGRGWTAPGAKKVSATEATLVNRVTYSVYVGGPWPQSGRRRGARQARVMNAKGWPSLSDVAREEKRRYRRIVIEAIRGRPGAR